MQALEGLRALISTLLTTSHRAPKMGKLSIGKLFLANITSSIAASEWKFWFIGWRLRTHYSISFCTSFLAQDFIAASKRARVYCFCDLTKIPDAPPSWPNGYAQLWLRCSRRHHSPSSPRFSLPKCHALSHKNDDKARLSLLYSLMRASLWEQALPEVSCS